jgi:hypothetical protein
MTIRPYVVRYPVSFWLSIGTAIVTALLAVAWHGILFIVAVVDVSIILALPIICRKEMIYVHGRPTDPPEPPAP